MTTKAAIALCVPDPGADALNPDTLRLNLLESTHAFVHVSHSPDAAPVFTITAGPITAHGTTLRAACDAALKL